MTAVWAACGKLPLTTFVKTLGETGFVKLTPKRPNLATYFRQYASDEQHAIRRQKAARAGALRDAFSKPPSRDRVLPLTAYQAGRGFVGAACVVSIGAICYYGLGLSDEPGAIDRRILWSDEVQTRIQQTYMYFGGSIAMTALSAVAVSRHPALLGAMMKNSLATLGATFAAMIGSGMLVHSMRYKHGFSGKQIAWLLHTGVMGAVVAPLCLLGGPQLIRAAWYTAGVVGGLSTVAMCAPSEKFLNWGGPLAIVFGLVFASSVGTMFLPPTSPVGATMYTVSIYGGLVLFGMFLLHDTQRIIKMAEEYPSDQYTEKPFDPINASISIYLDTLNIFIRLALTLMPGGQRKK